MDYKKDIIKDFKSLQGKYSLYEIWCDFLEMASISIQNSCMKVGWQKREEYGIPAIVYHMNTLSLETFGEYHTPGYCMNYLRFRR